MFPYLRNKAHNVYTHIWSWTPKSDPSDRHHSFNTIISEHRTHTRGKPHRSTTLASSHTVSTDTGPGFRALEARRKAYRRTVGFFLSLGISLPLSLTDIIGCMVKGIHSFVGHGCYITFLKELVSCGGLRGVREFLGVYRAFNYFTLNTDRSSSRKYAGFLWAFQGVRKFKGVYRAFNNLTIHSERSDSQLISPRI